MKKNYEEILNKLHKRCVTSSLLLSVSVVIMFGGLCLRADEVRCANIVLTIGVILCVVSFLMGTYYTSKREAVENEWVFEPIEIEVQEDEDF